MKTMLARRVPSMKPRTPCALAEASSERSASGITTWLEIIVESAIEATMTIEVADEKPPRKASRPSVFWSKASGNVST